MWSLIFGCLLVLLDSSTALRTHQRVRRVKQIPPISTSAKKTVALVIPARNEASNIVDCLHSVLEQPGIELRVVVVNDASEDNTAELASATANGDQRVKVLTLNGPPPGWAGKVHAMARGASGVDTDWVVFMDADVRLGANALSSIIHFAQQERLDLVSLGASQTQRSFPWYLTMPVGFQLILEQASPDGQGGRLALAVGHFILVKRDTYERVGGYEVLKASTADDVDFATLVRDGGGRTQFAWGGTLVTSAQLADWDELWRSWRKSLHAGTKGSVPLLVAGGVFMLVWGLAPWALLLAAGTNGNLLGMALALLSWGLQALGRRAVDEPMGAGIGYAPLAPLARSTLGLIMLDAGQRALLGRGNQWKGRTAPHMPSKHS